MASNPWEFWIKIGQIVIILIILGYFLYRRFHDKIRGFDWFIGLFSFAIVQSLIEIAIYFPTEYGSLDSNSAIQEIHIIPYAIGLFILFLYTELIQNSRPNNWHLGFISLLLGGYLAVYFIELGFNLELDFLPEYRIYRVIFNVLQAFVLAQAFFVFLMDSIKVEYKRLKRVSIVIASTMGVALLFSVAKIFERWTIQIDPSLQFYGAIPLGILFGVTAIAFIANPFYVYLIPTKFNKLIVLNESGILLYSVRIERGEPKIIEDTLLTGTVSALRTILAETTGARTDLRKISFKDKKMIVVEDLKKKVSTIVISDSDSYILQLAVKHFNKDFCKQFAVTLENFDGAISSFSEATSIVRRVFPFVPPEEIIVE
ncbi:MAG: hypothetical protein H7647_04715 [Candidatus Heimdallarchaeota archaeon]|nr:hypothetical protein [Candidatus Heimdallarchaeota archaeon]MCK4253726.1 hypothetical protein [Candidatus Heimdallarchaeota archaeon]